MPYVYNELRDQLLSAMQAAVKAELRQGRVDVPRLYRAFTRAAAKEVSNPVLVSEKCIEQNTSKPRKGSNPPAED